MADFEIKNIKDIENAAEGYGMAPDLEARFSRQHIQTEQLGFSYQKYAPGFRFPFGHAQKTQEEVYVVIGGGGRVKIDDDVHDVKQWDAVRVSPGTMRNFEAGPDGLELIVFGAPFTPPGDAETVQGWWSD